MTHSMWCDGYVGKACSCRVESKTIGTATGVLVEPVRTDRNGLVDPSIFTDDQLRAECERRGLAAGYADQLVAERDEWKRRAEGDYATNVKAALREYSQLRDKDDEAMRAEIRRLCNQLGELVQSENKAQLERDEWKRRALAAEAHRNEIMVRVHRAEAEVPSRRSLKAMSDAVESGHGIDPRPDNSIAHLDEDLLCDDA